MTGKKELGEKDEGVPSLLTNPSEAPKSFAFDDLEFKKLFFASLNVNNLKLAERDQNTARRLAYSAMTYLLEITSYYLKDKSGKCELNQDEKTIKLRSEYIKLYKKFIDEKIKESNGKINFQFLIPIFSSFNIELLDYVFYKEKIEIVYPNTLIYMDTANLVQLFGQRIGLFFLNAKEMKLPESKSAEHTMSVVQCLCRLEDITKERFNGKTLIECATNTGQDFPNKVYKYLLDKYVEDMNLPKNSNNREQAEKTLFVALGIALEVPEGKMEPRDLEKAEMILSKFREDRNLFEGFIRHADIRVVTSWGRYFPNEFYGCLLSEYLNGTKLEKNKEKREEAKKVLFESLYIALGVPLGKTEPRDLEKARMILSICEEGVIKKFINNTKKNLPIIQEVIKSKGEIVKEKEKELKKLLRELGKKRNNKAKNSEIIQDLEIRKKNKEDIIEEYKNILRNLKFRRKTLGRLKRFCEKRLRKLKKGSKSSCEVKSLLPSKIGCNQEFKDSQIENTDSKNKVVSSSANSNDGSKNKIGSNSETSSGKAKEPNKKPDLEQILQKQVKNLQNKKLGFLQSILMFVFQIINLFSLGLLSSFLWSKMVAKDSGNSLSTAKGVDENTTTKKQEREPWPVNTVVQQPEPVDKNKESAQIAVRV
jgi:hypothetical protein